MNRDAMADLGRLVHEALAAGASTVTLTLDEPPVFRVRGALVRREEAPRTAEDLNDLAIALVGAERLAGIGRTEASVDTRVTFEGDVAAVVNVARSGGVPTIVARPVQKFLFDVDRIGVPAPVTRAIESPYGLVLVTGPTGCGKTTTCYALLEHVNATKEVHIVSAAYHLEHVLEPKRALVTQRQIGVDAPDMLAALGSAMMHDPDVLFVGEIRELAVLDACLAAAETGHLVLTQLHQPTPAAAVRRIVELQPEETRNAFREVLASHLRAVLAQRLYLRADGAGRIPAYGWFVPDDAVRAAIAPGGDLGALDDLAAAAGETMEAHLARLVSTGVVAADASRGA